MTTQIIIWSRHFWIYNWYADAVSNKIYTYNNFDIEGRETLSKDSEISRDGYIFMCHFRKTHFNFQCIGECDENLFLYIWQRKNTFFSRFCFQIFYMYDRIYIVSWKWQCSFKLFLRVSRSQIFFPIWILIVLVIEKNF